jgi:hypothetical protein
MTRLGVSFSDKVHYLVRTTDKGIDPWMITLCNRKGMLMWDEVPEGVLPAHLMCKLCLRSVDRDKTKD